MEPRAARALVWIRARLKAVQALAWATVLSYLATWLLTPGSADQLSSVLPESWRWVAPVVIGLATAFMVERQRNHDEPAGAPGE